MTRITQRFALVAIGLFMLALGTGCQNRLQMERDQLYAENAELRQKNDQLLAELEAAEAENSRLMLEIGRLESELAEARATTPAPMPAASGFENIGGVEVDRTAGTIKVRIPGDVLFAPGKVELKSASKATLNDIVDVIRREYAGNTIRIEGYTDTDPIRKSKWKDNLELSLQRAASVHRYLQTRGLDPDRMYAAGFGESSPRETKAKSRRVEIVVVLNE